MKQPFYILCILPLGLLATPTKTNIMSLYQDGSNQFTAKMFYEVTKAKPEKSVVLSAISVMTPLAQIGLASVGESHNELLRAIGMPNDDMTKAVFSYANKELHSTEGVTLKTANKIYVAKNYELNNNFAEISRETFNSEAQNINFEDKEEAAKEINGWVEEHTNHRIKDLIDPNSLGENTRGLLVSAIHFKGLWEDPFEKSATEVKEFHVNKNNVINIPMMYRKGHYSYVENDELKSQIIEIPYKGYQASLIIILPRDVEGIIELEEKLKIPTVMGNILKKSVETEVEVIIPKFKIETTINLKDVLMKMNVTKMFQAGEAKINNLLKNAADFNIDSAIQKAFIEVDEEGAEANVANVFGVVGASFIINDKAIPVFNANKPFYFAIRLNSLTLFNGVLYGA